MSKIWQDLKSLFRALRPGPHCRFLQDNIVAPDKEITPTWEEYKSGRDAVLESVLAAK